MSPRIINNLIAKNGTPSGGAGGALMAFDESNPTVQNTIFWGNDTTGKGREISLGPDFPPLTLTIEYADIQGGLTSIYLELGSVLNQEQGLFATGEES